MRASLVVCDNECKHVVQEFQIIAAWTCAHVGLSYFQLYDPALQQ